MTNKKESDISHQQNDDQYNNQYNIALVQSLCDRIATLEQLNHEQELKIERLTNQISKLCTGTPVNGTLSTIQSTISNTINPRNTCGILVWQITDFTAKVVTMRANPNNMFYSPDFYTAPFGYRFCARISISPKAKAKDTISLHVHMMQSSNDYHLDWPFRGCIKISMVHDDSKFSLHDKIMTNEKVSAFQRPQTEISSHSFGFTEYAVISDIRTGGYISTEDILTIKIQISIV